jgi:prepilin-type N-terminal cleavage/methylation domain-containing protein
MKQSISKEKSLILSRLMSERGFSLVEILTTISIIVIVTGIIFSSYRKAGQQSALQRAANKIAADIRRVQQMAISTEQFEGTSVRGYGFYCQTGEPTEHYFLFANRVGDRSYEPGVDEIVEDVTLEKGITIFSLL